MISDNYGSRYHTDQSSLVLARSRETGQSLCFSWPRLAKIVTVVKPVSSRIVCISFQNKGSVEIPLPFMIPILASELRLASGIEFSAIWNPHAG